MIAVSGRIGRVVCANSEGVRVESMEEMNKSMNGCV